MCVIQMVVSASPVLWVDVFKRWPKYSPPFNYKMLCWLFEDMPPFPNPIMLLSLAFVFKRKVQCYVTCEFN